MFNSYHFQFQFIDQEENVQQYRKFQVNFEVTATIKKIAQYTITNQTITTTKCPPFMRVTNSSPLLLLARNSPLVRREFANDFANFA